MEDLVIAPEFWAGRRVFLTGHTGFKGAWACAMLSRLGAKVTGFALDPPTQPRLFDMAKVGALVTDIRGDIRDMAHLSCAMREADPEIVVHMAAQSLVRASYVDPAGTYETNVTGTVNVLEAARHCRARVIIVVTTDKCYRNDGAGRAFREDDALGGHDPYSSSKAAAEIAVASWRDSFFQAQGVALASVRAGNVLGGGDYAADRIVPDAIRAFAQGESVPVRNPHAVRPWQHVLEPLTGYFLLAQRAFDDPSCAGAWNFGPGSANERNVEDLIREACAIWGEGAHWGRDAGAHPHEAPVLRLDSAKAREGLGWSCRLDFAETMRWTVQWYRDVARGGDPAALMRQQIDEYFARVGAAACASL